MSLLDKSVRSLVKKYSKGKSLVKKRGLSNMTKAHRAENNPEYNSVSDIAAMGGDEGFVRYMTREGRNSKAKAGRVHIPRGRSKRTVDVSLSDNSGYIDIIKATKSLLKGKSPLTEKRVAQLIRKIKAVRRIHNYPDMSHIDYRRLGSFEAKLTKLQDKLRKGSNKVVTIPEGDIEGVDFKFGKNKKYLFDDGKGGFH